MIERRKCRRIMLKSTILLRHISGADEMVAIDVTDVSKTGMGFDSHSQLSVGEIYEAYLTIWTKEKLHVFVSVVRTLQHYENNNYGAIFVGMPEIDGKRIETYDTIVSMQKQVS